MAVDDHRKILLTPGPLTTAEATRRAMLRDWGSRDGAFTEMSERVRCRLIALAGATGTHVCVPVQGSGTFAVEATLGTLVPPGGKVLALVNGAYGRRIVRICEYLGRACEIYETAEDTAPEADQVANRLAADGAISHVILVHCETTSGILNPVAEIAGAVDSAGRRLILDSMSAFGALPLDASETRFEAMVASGNKCLEGVPGMGFAIIEKNALAAAEGNASSLSLDLHDQWRVLEKTGQWRFTPPTHVVAALDAALDALEAEGGVGVRRARYQRNCRVLVEGLRDMGLETFLSDQLQAPIIVTVHMPRDKNFDFARLYDLMCGRGVIIYPGSVTETPTFRMGCIGDVHEADMERALDVLRFALDEMGCS